LIGVKQIACGASHTALLLNNGQVYTCGNNTYGQLGNGTNSNVFKIINPNVGKVIQISCGNAHTALLLNNGQVYTCGINIKGQLGRITNSNVFNPEFKMIDRLNIKNTKLYLLSIGCTSASVFVLY